MSRPKAELQMVARAWAQQAARRLSLRADMAADFEREGRTLPPGPTWALWIDDRLVGMGGLTPHGGGVSGGWLLIGATMDRRAWTVARRAIREVLAWARTRSIRRIVAVVEAANAGAAALLTVLGFQPTDRVGDDITLTLELT